MRKKIEDCERCNQKIDGTVHRFIFIINGKDKWLNICNTCYKEVLKKQGEKRTEKEYRKEWLQQTKDHYSVKNPKDEW